MREGPGKIEWKAVRWNGIWQKTAERVSGVGCRVSANMWSKSEVQNLSGGRV